MKPWLEHCCPIIEQTADGERCGRCWLTLDGMTCPRHGDVSVEVERFKSTGKCTIENELRRRRGLPLLTNRRSLT